MLSYWILRDRSGASLGLVRVENDRVVLRLKTPVEGAFTLFSETEAVPIVPDAETRLIGAQAVLGTENGRITCFAAAPGADPAARYRERMSRIRTKPEPTPQSPPEPDPPAAPAAPMQDDPSRKNTKPAEEPAQKAEQPEHMPQNSTIETPPSVTETARETEAFSLLLRRADAFYARWATQAPPNVDNMVQKEDNSEEERGIDLFRQTFPGARWRYVEGADVLGHYEGVYRQPNGVNLHILAVRGRAAPCPPRTLNGFSRFLRAEDGTGYWIQATPLP